MGIHPGGIDFGMPHQYSDFLNRHPVAEQVRCERVPEPVRKHPLHTSPLAELPHYGLMSCFRHPLFVFTHEQRIQVIGARGEIFLQIHFCHLVEIDISFFFTLAAYFDRVIRKVHIFDIDPFNSLRWFWKWCPMGDITLYHVPAPCLTPMPVA